MTPSGIEMALGSMENTRRCADLHMDLPVLDEPRWGHESAVEIPRVRLNSVQMGPRWAPRSERSAAFGKILKKSPFADPTYLPRKSPNRETRQLASVDVGEKGPLVSVVPTGSPRLVGPER